MSLVKVVLTNLTYLSTSIKLFDVTYDNMLFLPHISLMVFI
jgi:hypothetical protein